MAPGPAPRVGARLREQAGTVEVQEGGKDIAGEFMDELGAPWRDVPVADLGAEDVSVLTLGESVVIDVPGPRLGELGFQLREQGRHPAVDVLGAVVSVEAIDYKGKRATSSSSTGIMWFSEIVGTTATN